MSRDGQENSMESNRPSGPSCNGLSHSKVWCTFVKIVREVRKAHPDERLALADQIAFRKLGKSRWTEKLALAALRVVAWIESNE
jgi:hypothetical protein